jgi:hypothetical protein
VIVVEERLDRLESGRYTDAGEAIGELAVATAEIARMMNEGDDEGRIAHLVARLRNATETVARQSRARGFSISVGFPIGVSVSVDWGVSDPGTVSLG